VNFALVEVVERILVVDFSAVEIEKTVAAVVGVGVRLALVEVFLVTVFAPVVVEVALHALTLAAVLVRGQETVLQF